MIKFSKLEIKGNCINLRKGIYQTLQEITYFHVETLKSNPLKLGEKTKKLAVTTSVTAGLEAQCHHICHNSTRGPSQYIRQENEIKCQGIGGK